VDADFAKDYRQLRNDNNNSGSGSRARNGKTVRLQIDEAGVEPTQGEVPVDGSVYVLSAPLDGNNALDAFIVVAESAANPSCLTFVDEKGTIPLGVPFLIVEAQLDGVIVKSLICKEG
jgi:hypothetical protein